MSFTFFALICVIVLFGFVMVMVLQQPKPKTRALATIPPMMTILPPFQYPPIIHLVLFSESEPYREMMQITRPLYAKYSNIARTIYYCFDETLPEGIEATYDDKNMCLRIRGKETYVPGILVKTLQAIQFVLGMFPNLTYIVRSNVSSVIDLPKLVSELNDLPQRIDYGGFMINELQWIDPAGGVVDQTWWGTRYASGTCIILSKRLAEQMVQERDKFRMELVDDLSIGVWVREHCLKTSIWSSDRRDWMYRNRQSNRQQDLENMHRLVERLLSPENDVQEF